MCFMSASLLAKPSMTGTNVLELATIYVHFAIVKYKSNIGEC